MEMKCWQIETKLWPEMTFQLALINNLLKKHEIIFSHEFCRSGTLNSNTVNSKFHLIRSFFQIFARFLSFHV